MGIGSVKIAQLALCTWNLERTVRSLTGILGVSPSEFVLSDFQKVPAYTRGKPDDGLSGICASIFQLADDIIIEVYGPTPEGTPWRDFLEKHGEGIMNLAFYVPDRAEAYKAIGMVCEAKAPYHAGFFPDCTYSFVDTTPELGFELNIKQNEDNTALAEKMRNHPEDYNEKAR